MNDITKLFIRDNLNVDVPTLALRKAPVGTDFSLALRQIEARQLLQKKAPEWSDNEDLLFPNHLSIEQCSSEATARYKSHLLQGRSLADLTGGLGIDTYYLSQNFQQTDYVERQSGLCDLAKHNFEVLKTHIKVWNETAEDYLFHCEPKDCLYLDPARRDSYGRKTVSISDCTPDVLALQDQFFQKADNVMVKLSPMLDISKAFLVLKQVKEVHVLAVNNECKELVFLMQRGFMGQPTLFAANLLSNQPVMNFTITEEHDCPLRIADHVMQYLYEPNAALMKAGCYKLLADRYGLLKLHKNSHLYTSDTLVSGFPGRIFVVEGSAPYHKKVKNTLLSDLDKANLAVRNFPLGVDELRKTLKIKEGGETFLFATTLRNEEKVIVRTKKSASIGSGLNC